MPRVVHFEISADDPARAADFYKAVFGWKIEKTPMDMDYWIVTTGDDSEPGINGGIGKRGGKIAEGSSVTAFVCTINVLSIEEYVAKVEKAGGTNYRKKMAIPNVGWLAYCKDTEGNSFGFMQRDPSAK